jgi:hypothetical protein
VLRTFDSSKDDKTRPQDEDLLVPVKPGLPLP